MAAGHANECDTSRAAEFTARAGFSGHFSRATRHVTASMRLLFVHERFGSMAGAEVNAHLTATELKDRGHAIGLLHGPATGKGEATWAETFAPLFPLNGNPRDATRKALQTFQPDAV